MLSGIKTIKRMLLKNMLTFIPNISTSLLLANLIKILKLFV